MKNLYLFIITIFMFGCLKAKKSAFDISSPAGFFGFIFLGQNTVPKTDSGTSASVPRNPPASLNFTDTDFLNYGKIGGTVNVSKASDESDIDSYNIYFGISGTAKYGTAPIKSLAKSGSDISFTLSENTAVPPGVTHLLAYSSNSKGENSVPASASIRNYDKIIKYLYVYDSSANLKYYSVSASGALNPVTTYTVGSGSVKSVISDRSGKFLFCSAGGFILPRTVNSSDGTLNSSPFTSHTNLQGTAADSAGLFLLASASNAGSFEFSSYSISQSNAQLTLLQNSPYSTGTASSGSVFLDRTGGFAFVIQSSGVSSLYSYGISSSGSAVSSFQNTGMPTVQTFMIPHPSLNIMYLSSGTSVYAYSVSLSNGSLTVLGNVTAGSGGLKGLSAEQSGKWIYAASSSDNSIYKISLNSDGTFQSSSSAASGLNSPSAVQADPTGRFLFVSDASNTRSYLISSTDGSLSLQSSIAGSGAGPGAIAAVSYTE